MSGAKRPHSVFEAWAPETPTTASKPSWIARRGASTKPPAAPPRPPAVPAIDETPFPEERESAVIEKAQPAAPPPAVDLGLSAALAQMAEENAELRAQVTEMAATMVRLKREVLESSEPELVRLALTIAERVVGHELSKDGGALLVEWARESVQTLAAKDEVVIALARDVAAQVPSETWSTLEVPHTTAIDPALGAGTIEIRTPEGVVVDGAPSRFGAVADALGLVEP